MTSIRLTPGERQELLGLYRRSADPEVRLRAYIRTVAHTSSRV